MKHFTIIICTKDRPEDLVKLLHSIKEQTRQVNDLIIVDGSDQSIECVLLEFKGLPIQYFYVRPPGLTKQRNFGLNKLAINTNWVGFLDDDVVLEPNCLQELEFFIEKNPTYAGIGLRINNQPSVGMLALKKLFLTDDGVGGQLSKSGIPTPIRAVNEDLRVDWIYGGATFWKKNVFEFNLFDEWFGQVGYLEDVDFSYKVSRKFPLGISSKSRCYHYHKPVPRSKQRSLGSWRIVANWYFITKHNNFKKSLVLWSMFGIFLHNFLSGLLLLRMDNFLRSMGNLDGFYLIFTGKFIKSKGFQK